VSCRCRAFVGFLRRPWPTPAVYPSGEGDEPNKALVPRPDRVDAAVAEGVRLATEGEPRQEPPHALVHAKDGEDVNRAARTVSRSLRRGGEAAAGIEETALLGFGPEQTLDADHQWRPSVNVFARPQMVDRMDDVVGGPGVRLVSGCGGAR
jgi:hypothetical protein